MTELVGKPDWMKRITCVDVWRLYKQGRCRQCRSRLRGRRTAYCGRACSYEFARNHFWSVSRRHALRLSDRCARCKKTAIKPEVNHKTPLVGSYRSITCLNHQTNLEVLCRTPCHVAVTTQQRRSRR